MFQRDLRFLRVLVLSAAAILVAASNSFASDAASETKRWERFARSVTITRDDWGIAHVVGKTDADTVFGAIYAQAEDDFNRVETNYLNSMGRLAESEGESAIIKDLRMKLFVDPVELKQEYGQSPKWLRDLMDAWADGLNFFLAKHPEIKPHVITHFEPWMALSFTEGSIGGDIETINLGGLQRLYGDASTPVAQNTEPELFEKEPSGSNGMAVSPKNTTDHHSLLLINPHTSFYFRSELQMTSGQGLNAYGASTWGQFFIYQGFNSHCGWMHTSSAVDAVDEFIEKVTKRGDQYFYKHGAQELPVTAKVITVPYKTASGMAEKRFTVYYTMHGPVVRKTAEDGSWVSISLMKEHIKALTQSYIRTKSKNYNEYHKAMELFGNSSNNTIYADAAGNIAYFHGNYIPRRDTKFDWTKPVDGSDPATDYKGLLRVDEAPNLFNPASGWLYNSNDWPWEASGPSSRKQADFPKYVDSGVPSARGKHAVRVLENKKDFSLEGLRAAAYDSYLTWFDRPLPALIKAWDSLPASDALKQKTRDQIAVLRPWDLRWRVDSVPTALAIYWAEELQQRQRASRQSQAPTGPVPVVDYIEKQATPQELLNALVAASDKLTTDFGKWNTPWGEVNRFQRLTDDIVHPFTDAGPSIPVGFPSATWGSLASFGARPYRGSKKWYGTSGNSFVAVVEFGPKVRAIAVTAGGESGHTDSKHFNDQAERYATGNLRQVYYYPDQLKGHTERVYKPGQ